MWARYKLSAWMEQLACFSSTGMDTKPASNKDHRLSCWQSPGHTFTVFLSAPLASRLPSGLKAKLLTEYQCPAMASSSSPLDGSTI